MKKPNSPKRESPKSRPSLPESSYRRSRRTDPMHFVFRRDPAPARKVPLDVIALFHSGHRLLIGTAGNREDAEALKELVVIGPESVVASVVIERRTAPPV